MAKIIKVVDRKDASRFYFRIESEGEWEEFVSQIIYDGKAVFRVTFEEAEDVANDMEKQARRAEVLMPPKT